MLFMTYDADRLIRNADFILIAQGAIPQPSAPQALSPPERKRTQPFYITLGAKPRQPSPLNPQNPLNLLNPHARKGV